MSSTLVANRTSESDRVKACVTLGFDGSARVSGQGRSLECFASDQSGGVTALLLSAVLRRVAAFAPRGADEPCGLRANRIEESRFPCLLQGGFRLIEFSLHQECRG